MRLFLVTFWFLLTCSVAAAQEQSEQPRRPATKLEAFQARTGVVLIRGYTPVGMIRGIGATITVDAREFRDAGNPNSRATGISIAVKETGRLERENTSFVDADEIESLLKGIEYIAKISRDATMHVNFEAEYRTKGDLRITVYNQTSGKISAAITSGTIGRTQAFIEMRDLEDLQGFITEARAKL
ncbi:MAG: hypothetical protein C3F12_07945 [Candidatus Methylomirabilota bacterium]|nr:hypothetical protein [Candidatus Methylomirabilis sp.]NJD67342.1 hypothetical protein [candidate division NC10 bacterium]PWB45990.1 MAG: hypothetical protein C3F12_07945 [candidate division NC10 bacterium]